LSSTSTADHGVAASPQQLRSFGLLVGGIFALTGIWPAVVRGLQPRLWAIVLGSLLILPGLVAPRVLRPAHKLWMGIAHVLGWINSRIIMAVVFFVVFTPVAFFLRLMKKSPIRLGFDKTANSYRVIRQSRLSSHMKNQF
jgi:hypothetical protein